MTAALADIHEQLGPYHSEIAWPSVDPELTLRMLIIGCCYGLRPERQADAGSRAAPGISLDLDDKVPHHSTFSENRLHRFRESDVVRHIFERGVATCMATKLDPNGKQKQPYSGRIVSI